MIFSCELNTPNCLNEWLNLNDYLTSKTAWKNAKGFTFLPLDRFGMA